MQPPRRAHRVEEDAVDAEPHAELSLVGLDVDVARAVAHRRLDDEVDVPHDRRAFRLPLDVVGDLLLLLDFDVVLGDVGEDRRDVGLFAVPGRGLEHRLQVRRGDQHVAHERRSEPTLHVVEQEDVVGAHRADDDPTALAADRQHHVATAVVAAKLREQIGVRNAGLDPAKRNACDRRRGLLHHRLGKSESDEDLGEATPRGLLLQALCGRESLRVELADAMQQLGEILLHPVLVRLGHVERR